MRHPKHRVVVYDVKPSATDENPVYFRQAPLRLLWNDAGLLMSHYSEFFNIFNPWPRTGVDITNLGMLGQIVLFFVTLGVTVFCIVALFFPFLLPLAVLAIATVIQLSNWFQGPHRRLRSRPDLTSAERRLFEHETWMFVNGVATSASGTQLIIDELQAMFHRPIIGICNRTYGFLWDLIECTIQRDLLWPTTDVREGYKILSKAIRDESKTRVVLMSHSQGGIILSAWIDQLLVDFSFEQLNKVQIYTFASAANHFSAPVGKSDLPPFDHVEHFVNTRDYISLIGVLAFAPAYHPGYPAKSDQPEPPEFTGRYAGRIFKRVGATGHLLLSHYLNPCDSILDNEEVIKFSNLVKYLDGKDPAKYPAPLHPKRHGRPIPAPDATSAEHAVGTAPESPPGQSAGISPEDEAHSEAEDD